MFPMLFAITSIVSSCLLITSCCCSRFTMKPSLKPVIFKQLWKSLIWLIRGQSGIQLSWHQCDHDDGHLCGESAVLGSLLYLLLPPPCPGEPAWKGFVWESEKSLNIFSQVKGWRLWIRSRDKSRKSNESSLKEMTEFERTEDSKKRKKLCWKSNERNNALQRIFLTASLSPWAGALIASFICFTCKQKLINNS